MESNQSLMSCGVVELSGVGDGVEEGTALDTLQDVMKAAPIVTASLTIKQKEAIAFLLEYGFTQVTEWTRNPSSRNRIALFACRVTKPLLKAVTNAERPARCEACGTPIPRSKR